jgi:hypothetical protein
MRSMTAGVSRWDASLAAWQLAAWAEVAVRFDAPTTPSSARVKIAQVAVGLSLSAGCERCFDVIVGVELPYNMLGDGHASGLSVLLDGEEQASTLAGWHGAHRRGRRFAFAVQHLPQRPRSVQAILLGATGEVLAQTERQLVDEAMEEDQEQEQEPEEEA